MRKAVMLSVLLLPAVEAAAFPEEAVPAGVVTLSVEGSDLTLWPYTFQEPAPPGTPSDPINLIFLGSEPRAIRRALMGLDGSRPAPLAAFDCVWTDAMGNEQAAWAEPSGWVGGEVQLACTDPEKPLGSPFRFHLRLFREGAVTLGGAHFEINIPGTAEHETLSWDLARDLVTFDLARAGAAPQPAVAPIGAGTFGVVRRPIFDVLDRDPAGHFLLASLGLHAPPDPQAPVPIPTSGLANVVDAGVMPVTDPVQSHSETVVEAPYDVTIPKPFCGGPADYVHLDGTLHLRLRVHTNPSGMYERTYVVSGMLTVTPLGGGPAVPAAISEYHRALLTDHYGEVTQHLSQTLLGEPTQSLTSSFRAGQVDQFSFAITCEAP